MTKSISSTIGSPGASELQLKPMLVGVGGCLALILVELGIVPSIPLWSLFLLVVSVLFSLARTSNGGDTLHPVRVFGSLWCFCLFLASLRLLPIISQWSNQMWVLVITALLAFVSGFGLMKRRFDRSPRATETIGKGAVNPQRTLAVAALCIAAGCVVLLYEYHLIGEIPILSENIDVAKGALFGPGSDPAFDKLYIKLLHLVVEFIRYGMLLCAIALVQQHDRTRKVRCIAYVLLIFGGVMYASQGARSAIASMVIQLLALVHYLHRMIRPRDLVASVIVLFMFIGLYGSYRVEKSDVAPLFNKALSQSCLPEGQMWAGIGFGYLTLTSSFEVFYRLTDDLKTLAPPHGGYLFYAFHSIIPRSNLGEVAGQFYSGELVTATFIGEVYADYGVVGVIVGSLFLGMLYGCVYVLAEKTRDVYWNCMRAILLSMLLFLPYANLFSQYVTWILDCVAMYYLLILCHKRVVYMKSTGA